MIGIVNSKKIVKKIKILRKGSDNMNMENIKKMKKAEIHIHLDGSVRTKTVLDLANKGNIDLAVNTVEELEKYLQVDENNTSLVEYLEKFELPVAVMQTKENLERIAFELLEDLAKRNYIYAEIRFAPHLHLSKGLNLDEIVTAVLDGFKKARKEYGIEFGLLLSIMRHMPPEKGMEILELASKFKDEGVVGIDLAGDEYNFSVKLFEKVFKKAKKDKINFTIHAGEASGAKSVEDALDLGATRIGHGVRANEDKKLLQRIIDDGIVLEICPISNYQTKVVSDFSKYPIIDFLKKGVKVSLNTDNQKVSNTTLTKEIEFLDKYLDINEEDVKKMIKNTVIGSFVNNKTKEKLLKKLEEE